MRARQPDIDDEVTVDGVTIAYSAYGDGDVVVVLMPTWCIVHAEIWKMQVPYLSRHFRVVTWDGPGNGRSSRPSDPDAYTPAAHVRYALAVLDALGIDRATAVASSGGTHRTLRLATDHADRINGVVFVGPLNHLVERRPDEVTEAFMSGDLERYLNTFMTAAFNEPHSTKAIEDGIGWGRGTTMEILAASRTADAVHDPDTYRALCASVAQPVLVVQGAADRITPTEHGAGLADLIGDNARLMLIEGGGHRPDVRDPVRFAVLLRGFVEQLNASRSRTARWTRGTSRPKKALYLSSPIGLGHARRDVAIARELRARHPDLEIHWLAQDPVTRVLERAGETIHPASSDLANESGHMLQESRGHHLHVFQAWRRMDEILAANFMVLHDALEADHYDLVIGDEAWEADHFLHENPELKKAPFAWLTDFVGWLPMPEGGDDERRLTTDYNLEMIEHVARYPTVRDRSIFVGDPEDIVPDSFGDGLPTIRSWTEDHFDFSGYITDVAPMGDDERARVRAELGFAADEKVCVATVGGSGVGTTLLEHVIAAGEHVRRKIPEFRLVVVAGPRIDASVFGPPSATTDIRGFIPDLDRYLAVCDLAVIQGGLTTAMELTLHRRPFLYFPLGGHFEQRFHVPHRLERYGAGRRMENANDEIDGIAGAMIEELDRQVAYAPVATDGAARAAAMIGELIG